MKICEDCTHLTRIGLCVSPENGVSMVTGKPTPMFAIERRSAGVSVIFTGTEKCGPEAKHFQPKSPPPKRVWWKFWEGMKPPPSNAIGQRGAASGASDAPTGCASNGDTEEE